MPAYVFSSFSSAITLFPSRFHTVYINTKLKEGNRCVSGSLACLHGFVCPCLWACPGPPPPWLLVLHGIVLAGVHVFVIDQAGRPAFAVPAVLCLRGPGHCPGLAWPGRGWAANWPAAAGPRPGIGTLGLRRAVGAQWPWFPGPRARGEVRDWPVVPRVLLAAAAGFQHGPAGLNYDACPCPCTHVHASSSSSHIPYEITCDVVLGLTRRGLDEDKHEARRGKQLARSLNPACEVRTQL